MAEALATPTALAPEVETVATGEKAEQNCSPREEKSIFVEDEDEFQSVATAPRASLFVRAASTLASRAGRLSLLPRSKARTVEETESEASPRSESIDGEQEATTSDSVLASAPLLPWQTASEDGQVVDDLEMRHKILELTAFRNTFLENPGGEEEHLFEFARYSDIAKELLLCDPSLREMHSSLVPLTIAELSFWRNFFLRCNALCIQAGKAAYLPEAKSTFSKVSAVASFQKFKRDMLIRRRSSTDRLRRTILRPRNSSADFVSTAALEVELGDLDLDMDGEIDKELRKRRPSRAIAPPGA